MLVKAATAAVVILLFVGIICDIIGFILQANKVWIISNIPNPQFRPLSKLYWDTAKRQVLVGLGGPS
jgi:hypothetical protein